MSPGSAAGLACGFVAMTLISVALTVIAGGWGLLGSALLWAVAMVVLVDVGDLYARNS